MLISKLPELLDGSIRELAQAISAVENESPEADELLSAVYAHTGSAYRLGVTGPPGAGKSTLVNDLIDYFRAEGEKVAVISVDPTSPFSGGAILGDRLRMGKHYTDKNVFIRSMATRGNSGGLARRSQEVADLLDAAQFDTIIFETVGVGQIELDVMEAVDTTLVVLVPESGDDIQLMKAGIIEIADVFTINKADREGAGQLHHFIEQMLTYKETDGEWTVPVLETSATQGVGIEALHKQLRQHLQHLLNSGGKQQKRLDRERKRVELQVSSQINSAFWNDARIEQLESLLGQQSPIQIAQQIVGQNIHDR